MNGARVRIEYENNIGSGTIIKTPDGRKLILSAARNLAMEDDPNYAPDLSKLYAVDDEGNRTGMKWARWQFQMEGSGPVTPTKNPEKPVDVDILLAEPINPNLGSAASDLVEAKRASWEALSGYQQAQRDPTLLSAIRLYTGTTLSGNTGTVLTDLEEAPSSIRPDNIGGSTMSYQGTYGVTGVISSYTLGPPSDQLLKQTFNVTLAENIPQGQIIQTTPANVVMDALAICGPGIVTPTP